MRVVPQEPVHNSTKSEIVEIAVLQLQKERHERSVDQGVPERISAQDADQGVDVPVPQMM